MKLSSTLLSVMAFASTVIAAPTPTATHLTASQVEARAEKRYHLKSCLKPGQDGKEHFDNLYIHSYHTGAGLGDATFSPDSPPEAYLVETNRTNSDGQKLYDQRFDLGTDFPWAMDMAYATVQYSGWQPVRINAGEGPDFSGFFIDDNGLEWSNKPDEEGNFGGWMVCDWWHSVPQLFFRNGYYDYDIPSNCADIYLTPEYV